MEKLQEIMNYIDHINADVSRQCDKVWLQEQLRQLEKELHQVLTKQHEEISR